MERKEEKSEKMIAESSCCGNLGRRKEATRADLLWLLRGSAYRIGRNQLEVKDLEWPLGKCGWGREEGRKRRDLATTTTTSNFSTFCFLSVPMGGVESVKDRQEVVREALKLSGEIEVFNSSLDSRMRRLFSPGMLCLVSVNHAPCGDLPASNVRDYLIPSTL